MFSWYKETLIPCDSNVLKSLATVLNFGTERRDTISARYFLTVYTCNLYLVISSLNGLSLATFANACKAQHYRTKLLLLNNFVYMYFELLHLQCLNSCLKYMYEHYLAILESFRDVQSKVL